LEGPIEKFVQQNSSVNNEIARNPFLNDLLDVLPTEVTVRKKRGKIEQVTSMCSFSYVDDADLEILNKNGRFKITAYDRRVYNAVGTLWLNERRTISLTEIFAIMNGYAKSNPSSKQLQAVERSIAKLNSIRISIDMTEEAQANIIKDKDALIKAGILKSKSDKVKSVILKGNMLYCEVGVITSEQGKVFKIVQIIKEPSLLTYNRVKNTLISIPMKYIGLTNSNATEKTMAFQDYLLMRIISYQRGKMRENKILYETLYRDSGIDRPKGAKDFFRDRETVRKLFDEWQKKGLILSYNEVKEGQSFVGIVFQVESEHKAIKENKSEE
jgi:hypothetical protein